MDFRLEDRLVLVTGSTEGIGFEAAKKYAQLGARVVINGRSQEKLDAALGRLGAIDGLRHAPVGVAGDVGTAEGVDALAAAVDALGELDVLVNNVAIYKIATFFEAGDDVWQKHFDVNVMSAIRLSRHFLPGMLERCPGREPDARYARILMISSETGLRPLTQFLHYSLTKTAMISLGRGLAELCKGTGVTVNSILPGPTATEGVLKYLADLAEQNGISFEEQQERYFVENEPTSLLARFLTPSEVANTIVFVGSGAGSGINGTAQKVEGGVIRSL